MDRLAEIELFVSVVQAGSFSGAARQLRIGQPAVSKRVAQLEERLGVRLVGRSSLGLVLTEAGQVFHAHARRALKEADEADLAARGAGAGLSGRLRFWAGVTLARLHIIPHLPQFLATHPDLTVEAVMSERKVDFVQEGVDVGFRAGVLADSSETARKIGEARRVVVGTPSYFKRAGEPATPAELAAHSAVVYAHRVGGVNWKFHKGNLTEAVTLNDRVQISAAEGVREAVFAGMGLCVASEWMFQPELASGKVRQILSSWSLPMMDLWAVYPTGRRPSAKARAFAGFYKDRLRKITLSGAESSPAA